MTKRDVMRGWGSHLWYRVTGSEVAHYAFRRWDGWMTMCGVLLPKAALIEAWEMPFCGNCGRARRVVRLTGRMPVAKVYHP